MRDEDSLRLGGGCDNCESVLVVNSVKLLEKKSKMIRTIALRMIVRQRWKRSVGRRIVNRLWVPGYSRDALKSSNLIKDLRVKSPISLRVIHLLPSFHSSLPPSSVDTNTHSDCYPSHLPTNPTWLDYQPITDTIPTITTNPVHNYPNTTSLHHQTCPVGLVGSRSPLILVTGSSGLYLGFDSSFGGSTGC